MGTMRLRRDSTLCRVVTGLLVCGLALNVLANPTGMTVGRGSATAHQSGSHLTVTASQNAFLNWKSFNIAAGETTTFVQPSANSIVWNRINDKNPSQIFGTIQANGVVVLLNSSGFYFGPNSFVSAAGLVVSTANCAPPENGGGTWEFNGPPPLASIINYGHIQVGNGGSAFLIADQVENHGTIEAPGGSIGLAAGQTITLSERPDGRGMSMLVTLPQGSVDNYGNLIADGGTIALNAKVVNQNGTLQANSVREQNGVIELVAADALTLGAGSLIIAQGDASTPGSSGGNITLKSGGTFSDTASSRIITIGGAQGGNGGNVEVSAPNILSLASSMDARAQAGWLGGMFLIDPVNIILGISGAGTAPNSGTVAYNSGSGTLSLNVDTAFLNKNFSLITLQATSDITLAANTIWDLSVSTGVNGGQLKLQAGGNIILEDGSKIFDANNWAVTLQAGYNFINNAVTTGTGSITFNGSSAIQTTAGNINLTAGQGISIGTGSLKASGGGITANALAGSITLDFVDTGSTPGSIQTDAGAIDLTAQQDIEAGSGFIITTGGGGITAHALTGNIGTGAFAQGYTFKSTASSLSKAYDLSGGLGGISTAAGGDVSLTAGGNVTSVLPGNGNYSYEGEPLSWNNQTYLTAGAGAYGSKHGDVTIVAGGDVTGNYTVANGTGSIFAGVKMDASGDPIKDLSGKYVLGTTGNAGTSASNPDLALSLISGGWNVTAAQNIILQEVRNPNGVFNTAGSFKHYFDYAPGDYVNLDAGNLVQLGPNRAKLPRPKNDLIGGAPIPMIFPSILNIEAGAGGVALSGDATYNQLSLFPSPQSGLTINTTKGGSLAGLLPNSGGAAQIFNLIVSDSGKKQFTTQNDFGLNDHAITPVHLNNPTPITLNISGDMSLVLIGAPEAAQITVGGNMNNSRFQGMNLAAGDVTSIHVNGDISNRGDFTTIDLSLNPGTAAPDLSYLSQAVDNKINGKPISASDLVACLFYDSTSQKMTYKNISGGFSASSILQLLQNLTVQVYVNGVAQWEDDLHTIPLTTTVSVLTPQTALALQNKYASDNAVSGLSADVRSPDNTTGFIIGGGGRFNVSAQNMELGTTAGIQSVGAGLYQIGSTFPLAKIFNKGADISVTTTGDMNMLYSSIASLNGGDISVYAGRDVNVASADFTDDSIGARGIFSTSGSDVAVYAQRDININGSRIGAFDGGNVTVESFNGDINAGVGGLGGVTLTAYYVDPVTHVLSQNSTVAFGSGILAETGGPRSGSPFYGAPDAVLGNVLVETPNGNVNANSAGILQLAFNKLDYPSATVEVLAGYELRDAAGKPVTAAQIGSGTSVPVFSSQNVITLGTPIQVTPSGSTTPISLTPVLDANGQPVLAANGQALYIQTADTKQQIVEFVSQIIQPYLDSGGKDINVAKPLDATQQPYLDGSGNPILVIGRNIDASNSGVVAQNAILKATGNVDGAIFAKGNIDVTAVNNANVTALAQGTVSASAGGDLSGTIIGIGGISASGGSVDAALLSNGTISGGTSGQSGFAQGTAANATAQADQSEDVAKAAESGTGDATDDDLKKKKASVALAQYVSRVTVLLPTKNN